MKKFNSDSKLYSFVMLLAGSLFLLFTGGKYNFWIAAWFPAVFYIRFFRQGKVISRYLLTVLASWVITLISWYGIQPLDFMSYAISMLITSFLTVLPLLGDRLLYKKVPAFASTLVFPVFSTFMEYIFISGNPMGSFGSMAYSQFSNRPFIQLASITGIMGLTFIMNWFPSVINHLWEKKSKKPAIIFASILMLILTFGTFSYFNTSKTEEVNVAGIFKAHDDIDLHKIMSADDVSKYQMADEIIESYVAETIILAEKGNSIISWPEASVIIRASEFSVREKNFSKLADDLNIYLVVPYMIINENSPFENKLRTYDPEGNNSLEHIKYGGNMFEGSLKGDGKIGSLDTEYGKISALICWDMDFPSIVSQTGRNNVDILFSPANEWISIVPVHAQMAVFRGIENGTSTVHPASMGLSIIADSKGRIISEENWFESEKKSISGSIPVKGSKTVYSIIGDLFPLLIMISTAMLIIFSIVVGIKKRIH